MEIDRLTWTLILPWFPILLGVGIGGRLLGPSRGLFLGLISALFWTVLAQAALGPYVWVGPWTVAALVAGAVAIAAVGAWAGQQSGEIVLPAAARAASPGKSAKADDAAPEALLDNFAQTLRQFDEWLTEHGDDADPWPRFDEFLRGALHRLCGARHVKPYRVVTDAEELVPLHEPDPLTDVERPSSRSGVVADVIATGRSYLVAPNGGETASDMALAEGSGPGVWCFSIIEGRLCRGVVCVGRLGVDPSVHGPLLETVELLINQFWRTLTQTLAGRTARQNDPVSTLLIRPAFLRRAEHVIRDAVRCAEPVAVAVFAIEGLRELNDGGRWEHADELVHEISAVLKRKVRADDCLGRFDGSRFVVLLRRVDAELASLIVGQLLTRLRTLCTNEDRWGAGVCIRCGITGSGGRPVELGVLLKRALANCLIARRERIDSVSDLSPVPAAEGSVL